MKSQKGQALIMVLLFLGVGTLLILPALQFTFTGLRSQHISEDTMANLSSADSAVQDALWQLLNQFMGTFDPSNPLQVYNFEYEAGKNLTVTIKIPSVPPSQNYGTGSVHNLMITVQDPAKVPIDTPLDPEPLWIDPPPEGESSTLQYIIRFDTQQWTLTNFSFTLPKGLTYTSSTSYYKGPDGNATLSWDAEVNLPGHSVKLKSGQWTNMTLGSYVEVTQWPPPDGVQPNISYLLKTTEVDGRQTLEWRPYFGSPSGRRIFIQTVQVTGTPPWGISYVPAVFQGGFGTIDIDQAAAMGVAMYTVLMNVGGVDYQVVITYDSSAGTFKIISYQIVE